MGFWLYGSPSTPVAGGQSRYAPGFINTPVWWGGSLIQFSNEGNSNKASLCNANLNLFNANEVYFTASGGVRGLAFCAKASLFVGK